MRQHLTRLAVQTSGEGFTDLTAALNHEIAASGLQQGMAQLVALHTSCSLTVNENADPRVLRDLTTYLRALVPQEGVRSLSGHGDLQRYAHDDEGLDFSFDRGRLVLGTWQAVYLWEHRARTHQRQLSLHLMGE
jgi:secondary thiamine-phosphate synthase enzyme